MRLLAFAAVLAVSLADDGEGGDEAAAQDVNVCEEDSCLKAGANGGCVLESTCDPSTGCAYTNQTDGEACDDGLGYTHGDACTGGVCRGTAVRELDADGFEDAVASSPLVLVWLYESPCTGSCELERAGLENVARNLTQQRDAPGILTAAVDVRAAPSAGARAGITSFPKARVFHTGELLPDVDPIVTAEESAVSLVMGWAGPSSVEVATAEELKQITGKKVLAAPCVVGLFTKGSPQGALDFRIFVQAAHQYRGVLKFYHVTSIAALTDLGHLGRGGAVMAYRPHVPKKFRLVYKGKLFRQALMDWVGDNALPPVTVASRDVLDKLKLLKRPLLRGFYWGGSAEYDRQTQVEKLSERLAPAALATQDAKDRSRRLLAVVTDGDDWAYHVMSKADYGFSDEDIKEGRAVVIEEGQRSKKIAFRLDGGDVEGWVARWAGKKLQKHMRMCFVANVAGASIAAGADAACVKGKQVPHGTTCGWEKDEGWECDNAGVVVCKDGAFNATPTCRTATPPLVDEDEPEEA